MRSSEPATAARRHPKARTDGGDRLARAHLDGAQAASRAVPASEPLQAALTQRQAEAYLGVGEDYLDDAPIPRVDLRKPGRTKPMWRWRRVDLDAHLAARLVQPGMPSPFR